MAEFDAAYFSAWSTPKIPRTVSTPGYSGHAVVSGGIGLTGEVSPFPPLLLGRSMSHALPGSDGSHLQLPASVNALFQPGVFQFQCEPAESTPHVPEPIRQTSEPVAAKPKVPKMPPPAEPGPSGPSVVGQERMPSMPSLPVRGQQGVTHRHRNEVGLCQEPAFSTVQLEQCIAQCRKEVEAIAAKCRADGQKFNDPDFPAAKTSLFASTPSSSFFGTGATNATWRRASEAPEGREGCREVEDASAVFQVRALSSYPLQGALATMRSMGKDPKELIVCHQPEAGVYGVRFFKDGEWMYEILDDHLPVSQNGRPLFSSCGMFQDWASLIEKGYAKVYGSYEAAANCQEEDAMEDVLGFASGRISVGDFPVWAELWQHLRSKHKRKYALAAIRRRGRPGEVLTTGLLGGCAYPVTSLDVINGHALVALENPWPQGKWNGSWGPDSLEALRNGMKQQPGCNTFWMSIQDFCQHFTDVAEARLIPSAWQSAMVSMSEERPSYPLVSVSSPSQAIFCLTQADSRLRPDRPLGSIGLRVYRCRIVAPPQHATGAKQNVSNPFKPLELLAERPASKVHSVTVELPKLEPNCLYVASTVYSPEASPDFAVLRVLTSMPMRFRELSVPESAYFLQAEEQASPAVDNDSFSSQGSMEQQAHEPVREDAMKAAMTDSRATGSAVSESCQGSEVSEHWQGDCGAETDLGFDFKLPPFLEDILRHCSGVDL